MQIRLRGFRHGLLDNVSNFLCRLRKHFVHILSHWVRVAQVLGGTLSSLRIRVQRSLILQKSDVVMAKLTYFKNSYSTAMLWYEMQSTIRRSSGFLLGY